MCRLREFLIMYLQCKSGRASPLLVAVSSRGQAEEIESKKHAMDYNSHRVRVCIDVTTVAQLSVLNSGQGERPKYL